jgi:hypothetical protein
MDHILSSMKAFIEGRLDVTGTGRRTLSFVRFFPSLPASLPSFFARRRAAAFFLFCLGKENKLGLKVVEGELSGCGWNTSHGKRNGDTRMKK